MSWKDQARRRKAAEKRGRRGSRRAGAMLLRQVVLHPVDSVVIDAEAAAGLMADLEGAGDAGT